MATLQLEVSQMLRALLQLRVIFPTLEQMIRPASMMTSPIGLMLSGGLDSAILLVKLLQEGRRVQPFYVSTGCQWEVAERTAIDELLAEINDAAICPLVYLEMPIDDLYDRHWCLTGLDVPDETTPDEAVFLPARNPLLLLKPALWCVSHNIPELAIATLAGNPFSDSTSKFCRQFEALIETATAGSVSIVRPFAELTKTEILSQAIDFPYHLTVSCLSPRNGEHCGRCNKCAERSKSLRMLLCGDPTHYSTETSVAFE